MRIAPGWLLVAAGASVFAGSAQASSRVGPVSATLALLAKVEMRIESFRLDCAELPPTLGNLLATSTSYVHCWKGPYARPPELMDYWGNTLVYLKQDGGRYSLHSTGRDGETGTADDISWHDPGHPYAKEYPQRWSWRDLSPVTLLVIPATVISLALCLAIEWGGQVLRRRRAAQAPARQDRADAPVWPPHEP